MQLMIDIAAETPYTLRLAAQLLLDNAAYEEQLGLTGELPAYSTPFAGPTAPAEPTPPSVVPVPPPPPAAPFVPPAPSNVVPFPPPASAVAIPPAPVATALPASAPPAVTTTSTSALPATTMPAAGPDEYDSSGMPFDARIHQKHKSKKKDGSWKLQKGIDVAIVTAVTTELAQSGRMRSPGSTPAAVGAVAPVALPGQGSFPQIPPPPQTEGEASAQRVAEENAARAAAYAAGQAFPQGNIQIPPPPPVEGQAQAVIPPAATAAVSVPPAPALGVPNTAQPGVLPTVTDFRSLVAKVTALRTSVPPRITAEQVTAIVQQAGAPSLQLLNSMPHLIATVDAYIDAHLVMG